MKDRDAQFIARGRDPKPLTAAEAHARLNRLLASGQATAEDFALAAKVIETSPSPKSHPKVTQRFFGRQVSKKRGADNNN